MAVGVAEMKGRLTIVDVVGETVQLKKAGTTSRACARSTARRRRLRRHPGPGYVALLRVRQDGDIFSFVMQRDSVVPRGAKTRRPGGRGARRASRREDAHNARLRESSRRDRLLPRGADGLEAGPGRPRLPARPRLHGPDDRDLPAGLGAGRLGPARPNQLARSARSRRRSSRGRASPARASAATARTTGSASGSSSRSATRTAPDRPGRPHAGQGGWGRRTDTVRSTSTRRRRRCSTRAARCT